MKICKSALSFVFGELHMFYAMSHFKVFLWYKLRIVVTYINHIFGHFLVTEATEICKQIEKDKGRQERKMAATEANTKR